MQFADLVVFAVNVLYLKSSRNGKAKKITPHFGEGPNQQCVGDNLITAFFKRSIFNGSLIIDTLDDTIN